MPRDNVDNVLRDCADNAACMYRARLLEHERWHHGTDEEGEGARGAGQTTARGNITANHTATKHKEESI